MFFSFDKIVFVYLLFCAFIVTQPINQRKSIKIKDSPDNECLKLECKERDKQLTAALKSFD